MISPFVYAESQQCKNIRFADIGWTDNAANNSLSILVAKGLGYTPQKTTASVPIAMGGLKASKIDVFMDYWSPALDSTIQPYSPVVNIGHTPNMVGAKYTLAVPRYLYDEGLHSFKDLKKFQEQLQGKIYGIESGSGGNKHVEKMIADNLFDTGEFRQVQSSEAAMLVEVRRAIAKKMPIVFQAWAPHPMNLELDFVYLTDGDAVFGPDFGSAKVYTILSKEYESTCPSAAKFIRQLTFTPEMESSIMQGILDKKDPEVVATAYLRGHQELLDSWLENVTTLTGENGKDAVKKYITAK
jgi:glycine betaine/proline transport system substrate-binding protein